MGWAVMSAVTQKPPMSERRVSLIGAVLAAIGPVSMALYTPAMPEIVHAFGTTEAAVKMSLSLYFAGFAFAQLVCGPISDGLGRRPVTLVFMAIYTASSFLAVFAPNIETLIVARLLQGVGAAAGVSMARAIVRDLFTHDQSTRIMNLIGIILAVGPALSPTIGGLVMEAFGWHAVFVVMAGAGCVLALVTILALRETVVRDVSRIQPRALAVSYWKLLSNGGFMTASLTNAGAPGALYALATMLPFVLMNKVGLTPSQFGLAMLMQSASFFAGSLVVRALMRRFAALALVPVGLAFIGAGSVALAILLRLGEPTLWSVMLPVACYAFGIAFVISAMTTAALAQFPSNAGAASALFGFMQMGAGLLGGTAAALIGAPVTALSTVIPALGLLSIVSWLVWRRLPAREALSEVEMVAKPAE
jgi:DHA1 family bicyclomycin/chloramphenicol resistance-like MFS transporter